MKNKKKIREDFRNEVFKRDNFTCKVCNYKRVESELDCHHITDRSEMPNDGYTLYNGISLCKEKCHLIAEQFHISGGETWEPGFHPNDLYKTIGSSYEKAVEESEKLT